MSSAFAILLFIGFTALSLFRAKLPHLRIVAVNADGLTLRTVFGREFILAWHALRPIRYYDSGNRLELRTRPRSFFSIAKRYLIALDLTDPLDSQALEAVRSFAHVSEIRTFGDLFTKP